MYQHRRASMFWLVLVSLALTATGEEGDDDWIDPYDMINYDSSTKTMRRPVEVGEFLIQYLHEAPFAIMTAARGL